MASNGQLDRDRLGEVRGVPGGGDVVRKGDAGAMAVNAIGSIGERLVRAKFRTDLRKTVESEINATEKLQNAMGTVSRGGTIDPESFFEDTDEGTARSLRGMLSDLDRTVGGLGAAVAQGLVPQQLALARLDTAVRDAANRFPGFGEDILSVINNSRLGGFDPRGTVARSILGIPDKTKKERGDIEKSKYDRLTELYKEAGDLYGEPVVLPIMNAVEQGVYTVDEGLLAMSELNAVRQAAARAKIESDRLTDQGEVLGFAVRPMVPVAMRGAMSEAWSQLSILQRAAGNKLEWAKEGPSILLNVKSALEQASANASNTLRQQLLNLGFTGANELSESDIAADVASLKSFYGSMAQAADEFSKDPDRFLGFAQLMSNVEDMESTPALYHMSRYLAIPGLAPLITMGTDFNLWRQTAAQVVTPATFPGQTSASSVDAAKQRGTKIVSQYFILRDMKGDKAAAAYLADIPSGQAQATQESVDVELMSHIALANKGQATITSQWYRTALDLIKQTDNWKGVQRSESNWNVVMDTLLDPNVLKKLPENERARVIDMIRPDVEDRTIKKINKLGVYNENMMPLVGRQLFTQEGTGAPVFDSALYRVDASGRVSPRKEEMLNPSDKADVERYKAIQAQRGRVLSDLNATTEMRKINGNWEAAAKVYNEQVLPLMRLNQRIYADDSSR